MHRINKISSIVGLLDVELLLNKHAQKHYNDKDANKKWAIFWDVGQLGTDVGKHSWMI
jgi:hypothetical protein